MNNAEYQLEERDVEYQRLAGKPWLVRLYQPKGAGPFPTMLDVHGGAWHNGDRMNNAGIDRELASRGILVAAVEFRQPPEAGYPASLCDVNLATRWLKAHAAEFNGTARVGAFGNSSGGHQVVLSALRPRHAAYSALPLQDHPELDASLAYVIAGWPVICPLYRFRFAKEHDRASSRSRQRISCTEPSLSGYPALAFRHSIGPCQPVRRNLSLLCSRGS